MWKRVVGKALTFRFVPKMRWFRLRSNLYCFDYHRIGKAEECPFDRGVFSCTQDDFRDQVSFLRRHFDVVGIDRLLRMQQAAEATTRPLALITFDDGYIDNYTLAFPVLQELGLTAVFNPPTSYVESRIIPWWDEIAWTLRNATVPVIRLTGSDRDYSLAPAVSEQSIMRVLSLVKHRTTIPMKEQLDEIRQACRPSRAIGALEAGLFVTWDQLRKMKAAGMDIGSHTHSHEILSHLDLDAQHWEMAESKKILESQLNCEITSIAYPVGTSVAYTRDTCRIARETGYKLGFNFINRSNSFPISDPFDIYRYETVF